MKDLFKNKKKVDKNSVTLDDKKLLFLMTVQTCVIVEAIRTDWTGYSAAAVLSHASKIDVSKVPLDNDEIGYSDAVSDYVRYQFQGRLNLREKIECPEWAE